MPLEDVTLAFAPGHRPAAAALALIADANERIDRFVRSHRGEPITGFVASDYTMVDSALAQIRDQRLATGDLFCEWGSGFGVVVGLAGLLGYASHGIEAHRELTDQSRDLLEDHHIEATLAHGSMVPEDGDGLVDELAQQAWLRTGEAPGYDELGIDAEDFDLFFAYPWPGDEELIDKLFETFAANGALLLTYHGINELRLQRKI